MINKKQKYFFVYLLTSILSSIIYSFYFVLFYFSLLSIFKQNYFIDILTISPFLNIISFIFLCAINYIVIFYFYQKIKIRYSKIRIEELVALFISFIVSFTGIKYFSGIDLNRMPFIYLGSIVVVLILSFFVIYALIIKMSFLLISFCFEKNIDRIAHLQVHQPIPLEFQEFIIFFDQFINRVLRFKHQLLFIVIGINNADKIEENLGYKGLAFIRKQLIFLLMDNTRDYEILGRFKDKNILFLVAEETIREAADIMLFRLKGIINKYQFMYNADPVEVDISINGSIFDEKFFTDNYGPIPEIRAKIIEVALEAFNNEAKKIKT